MNIQKINFSAKDLVSRSCMQIKMFLEKPELRPKPNLNQWDLRKLVLLERIPLNSERS